ncbi:hypothetical protein Tco_1014876, partial [Tanacetum coccineum]
MLFSKRQGYDSVCYTKPLDSLKGWNDHFFWVDAFACPASFPWHTSKSASKDPFPKSFKFNADHYATLVAYPALFHKYPEPFLCLVGMSRNYTLDENTYPEFLPDNDEEMDLLSFIRTVDPTKVRIGERQHANSEPKLMDITVGRLVPLLPVAPARTEGKLKASVDNLFDEGGSGNQTEQGDYATSGEGVDIQLVSERVDTVAEDVVSLQPRHRKKQKTVVVSAGGPSHPAKKLREDHKTPSVTFMAGKSMFVISLDSSHHSGIHVTRNEVDSLIRSSSLAMTTVTTITAMIDDATVVKEAPVKPSLFAFGSSSAGGTDPTPSGFSDLTGSDFLFNVGAACQISLSAEVRMRTECNIREKRRLKSVVDEHAKLLKVREKDIEDLKTQLLFKEAKAVEAIRLHAEVSKLKVVEKSLRDEAQVLKEFREQEVADLNDVITFVRSKNDNLVDQVHGLETSSTKLQEKETVYENCMGQLERFQDKLIKVVNDKFDKLYYDFVEMALHMEERFYPYLLTTIFGRQWLLTHNMELAITKSRSGD